jgi:hypothetical protein
MSTAIENMKRVPRKRKPPSRPKPPQSKHAGLGDHARSLDHTENGKFKVGNGYGGRPRGSRNKLGEQFLLDLQEVWTECGPEALKRIVEEKPHELVKVVASLLPRQLHVQMNQLAEYSDEQLELLRQMLERKTGLSRPNDPKLIEAQPVAVKNDSAL